MSVKAILHPTDQLVAELNDRGSVNARAVYMEGVSMPGLSNGVSNACQMAVKWLSNGVSMPGLSNGCQMPGLSMPGMSNRGSVYARAFYKNIYLDLKAVGCE